MWTSVLLLVLENHQAVQGKVILYVVPKAVKDRSLAEVKENTDIHVTDKGAES